MNTEPQKRERILFTCVGTTDPVRGGFDGPMLHIARQYRPERIVLFFSGEMKRLWDAGGRLEAVTDRMRTVWDYAPAVEVIDSGVEDVSDLDLLDGPLSRAMDRLAEEYPEAELLVNLTSGTPQMQLLLAQLALDPRYRARGIQVRSPERRAGTAPRNNRADYDVRAELAANGDEAPDAPDRCVEPGYFARRREALRQRLRSLPGEAD